MARGGHSPSPVIPKVQYTKVNDPAFALPAGVTDQQAKTFGYNDHSQYARPEFYIRYIEPLESELAIQVEYDMDEQDKEWLDQVNSERRAEQLDKVSYETFEVIMDRLEKEWFDLTKNIPKPDMALPSEDSHCAICDDAEGENSNAIVFCDGCNLAVHQDCYGVPYIPEGQWLCRKCTVSPENPVSCILCPNEGGAFKQTVHGDWVHLLCAIWVPETRVANDVFMEPITGVDKINKQRWKLKCSICGVRQGACIQCSKSSCFLAFHTTCARREKLLMPMKSAHGSEPATLACFCEKHLPKEQQAAHEAALAELNKVDPNSSYESLSNIQTPRSSKKARAYAKTFKIGPPLVPAIIVRRIMEYTQKIHIRKKLEFLQLVCRYWSLKREARRGAPLLKRLHLEPWTASTSVKPQTEEDKIRRLQYLRELRKDLESVRMLAELSRKRENSKLRQAQTLCDVVSSIFFPHCVPIRIIFERIVNMDRSDFFKNPVSKADVPDYFDVIKKPMCWKFINTKIEKSEYWNLKDFQDDVYLVLDNALLYNKADTPISRTATKMKSHIGHFFQELYEKVSTIQDTNDQVGDLEPPLSILHLLLEKESIQDDLDVLLSTDPLTSLFSYEYGEMKPPPPPKPKRDYKAERERRKLQQAHLDHSPGFRGHALRTRRAVAAQEAFEAEANANISEFGDGGEQESNDGGIDSASLDEEERRRLIRNGKRKKRPPMVLPGQGDVPPVVDDVDNQRSFKMFDEGWILPPNQRRGGRAPIERHELPPQKKRPRTDRARSTLSFSTLASENQTLKKEGSPELPGESEQAEVHSVPQVESEEPTEAVEVSQEDIVQEQFAPRIIRVPGKTTIIEEFDTPMTRKAKNMARKRRKLEAMAQMQQGSGQISVGGEGEEGSELSSLSSDEDEEDTQGARLVRGKKVVSAARAKRAAQKARADAEPASLYLKSDETLEGGTLVWAKAETYPWWPAVVYEEDDPEVPPSVLEEKDKSPETKEGPLIIVQFWDSRRQWQWLPLSKLRLLREDERLDAKYLEGKGGGQRFKTAKIKEQCRAAFRAAIAEMETAGYTETAPSASPTV